MDSDTTAGAGAAAAGDLARPLRRARELLADLTPPDRAAAAAERARDRLDRDLLPRTAGGSPYLVVGIVGPNNAGKSALFNALVGRELSPSLPTGGATRRLVGAAGPALVERLRAEPALSRFRVRAAPAEGPLTDATETPDDPAQLEVALVPELPAELLLIDTPDFDSILTANRRASEALLAVCDLALVVVTRHTYQNREVVTFLERWLAGGRPWCLVYNEAPTEEATREHAAKLAADLASEPIAVFWQRFDMAVQDGAGELRPVRLDGAGDLRSFLFDLERVGRIKAEALDASLVQLAADLFELARALALEAEVAAEVRVAGLRATRGAAEAIAAGAMPAGPFLAAFRRVLDRRGNPFDRGLRDGVRRAGAKLAALAAKLRPRRARDPEPVEARLVRFERGELDARWSELWERIARGLGPESLAVPRERVPAALAAALDADLADDQRRAAHERARAALEDLGADLVDFEQVCEELVERALEDRGYEWDMQVAADFVTVAPLALAALVIVKTGGLGVDLGVAGGGAATAFLTERYAHFLGAGITREARRRWTELRAVKLAATLGEAVLARSAPLLAQYASARAERAAELDALAKTIARARAARFGATADERADESADARQDGGAGA